MVNGATEAHPAPSRRFWAILLVSFGLSLEVATRVSQDITTIIVISALITLGLATAVTSIFLLVDLNSTGLSVSQKKRFAGLLPSIMFLFVIIIAAMLSTGVFGVGLTELRETYPKVGMNIIVVSIPATLLIFAAAGGTRVRHHLFIDGTVLEKPHWFRRIMFMAINRRLLVFLGLFGLCGGSILAVSLLIPELTFPIIMSMIGACGISYLVYTAVRAKNVWAKFGIYTISVILFYELSILVGRVLTYWGNTVVS